MNRCQCNTLSGRQCSRAAVSGSNFCTQHKNCKGNNLRQIISMDNPLPRSKKDPINKPLPIPKKLPVAKPLPKKLSINKPLPIPKKLPKPLPKKLPVRKPLPVLDKKTINSTDKFKVTGSFDLMPPEIAQYILASGDLKTLIKVCESLPLNIAKQVCNTDLFSNKLSELLPLVLLKKYNKSSYWSLLKKAVKIDKFIDDIFEFMENYKGMGCDLIMGTIEDAEIMVKNLPNLDKYIHSDEGSKADMNGYDFSLSTGKYYNYGEAKWTQYHKLYTADENAIIKTYMLPRPIFINLLKILLLYENEIECSLGGNDLYFSKDENIFRIETIDNFIRRVYRNIKTYKENVKNLRYT